jgi:hypothetical protein
MKLRVIIRVHLNFEENQKLNVFRQQATGKRGFQLKKSGSTARIMVKLEANSPRPLLAQGCSPKIFFEVVKRAFYGCKPCCTYTVASISTKLA